MNDNDLMPFGKYKGTEMGEVPAAYLLDILYNGYSRKVNKEDKEAVYTYIREVEDVLIEQKEIEAIEVPEMDESIDFDIYSDEL